MKQLLLAPLLLILASPCFASEKKVILSQIEDIEKAVMLASVKTQLVTSVAMMDRQQDSKHG